MLVRMADLQVRKVATWVGRCAWDTKQVPEEGIVKLSTWGRCLSSRGTCRRKGRQKRAWPHSLGILGVRGVEQVVLELRAQAS